MGYHTYHTIREITEHAYRQYKDCVAARYKTGKNEVKAKTYGQLREDSDCISNALSAIGEQGKHIALIGASSYEWLISYFGIVNGGSVAVPLDASLPAAELCELINRADVTALFVDAARRDVINAVKTECPGLKYRIVMRQENETQDQAQRGQMYQGDYILLRDLLKEYQGGYPAEITPETLCTIMFTSGTTGKSKGVMLTHRNLAENATCLDMNIPEKSVVLSVLPIHHAYCLCMDILKGFSLGSTICINDSLIHMAKNIKLFQPNIMLMVPLMIESLAKKLQAAKDLPAELVKENVFGAQFHTIFSGGAYLNPDYITLFERFGISILQGYGMTECSPVISTTMAGKQKKQFVGMLMPNCEAKTVDGELYVRGSSVMQGYYKMPEETKEALSDGWLKTGDLGYVDEEGYVYLTGRKKNLIITKNGENVSPEEIENKLGTSPLVAEILVREAEGVIEAEIFPDSEYAANEKITDIKEKLQSLIDAYNVGAPAYKRVYHLKVRENEFEKTASRKIKRF